MTRSPKLALVVGALVGSAYGLVARFLAETRLSGNFFVVMTLSFLALVPLAVGFLAVRPHPSPSWAYRVFMPWLPTLLSVVATATLGWEGSICIVMAIPVLLVLSSLGGILGGLRRARSRGAIAAAVCLPFALAPIEGWIPTPRAPRTVVTTIDVAASPASVWREIASVPAIAPEERRKALFTLLGFPAPISATLDRPGVGGIRKATFERGLQFVETVTVWKENEALSFTIDPRTDAIPPATLDRHVTIGGPYFDVLDGTYQIEPLAEGRTRLLLSSRTRVSTHFNLYAGPWSDAIMRSIQENILEIVRARAEAAPGRR